ncbi:hypothetical protein BBK36DRAFT_1192015 [Trichoderma citrinoviride]|uniref:Uncharacterized protein n=1 Tax=Trichoderma citrinoviride TaxID=58853 RepID=A0A2T4BHL1_9HYPO|nr:hypothetical protein BBK36DRAFT_1192015 [Trichoderma citrinoviride]PTB68802.1 hypothetical protein BBK36DRAFT_1192015 [Trichoderma citrinoviride]
MAWKWASFGGSRGLETAGLLAHHLHCVYEYVLAYLLQGSPGEFINWKGPPGRESVVVAALRWGAASSLESHLLAVYASADLRSTSHSISLRYHEAFQLNPYHFSSYVQRYRGSPAERPASTETSAPPARGDDEAPDAKMLAPWLRIAASRTVPLGPSGTFSARLVSVFTGRHWVRDTVPS